MAFRVLPLGPMSLCRRFTYRSLFRTIPPILITSHCTSSWRTFSAWGAGTERDRSLMRSRDLMMTYGSNVFLVVFTVMEPSTRLSSHAMPNSFSARVTEGHTSRRYFSRYLGNSVANEDSSKRPSGLSSLVNASTFQWSMPSWSHGLSRRYRPFLPPVEASSPPAASTLSGALSSSAPILFGGHSRKWSRGGRCCRINTSTRSKYV
mmetsp:Transcript_9385/g.42782  ORF Transcript_9385/g.42782 Transcript_9385/m.42782 type:complete len:206 (-) Transcript_9385:38-655(-)